MFVDESMVVFGIVLHDVNVGVWQVSTAVLSITAKAKKKEKEKKEKEEEKMEVVRQLFQKRKHSTTQIRTINKIQIYSCQKPMTVVWRRSFTCRQCPTQPV